MNIITEYDIGDIIKFNKVTTYPKKESERELHVGIIEKIIVSKAGLSYLMKSSYQNWVPEAEIVSLLEKGS